VVRAYRELLNNKPTVVVSIHRRNRFAVYRLGMLQGVKAVDGVNPDNPGRVEEFINCVKEVTSKHL